MHVHTDMNMLINADTKDVQVCFFIRNSEIIPTPNIQEQQQ